MSNIVKEVTKCVLKVGQDDPRRVVHSMKVGLAVTIVSLSVLLLSVNLPTALWAVLTVVVVFEFSANFANWEPSHGCFRLKHPLKQYLQLGALSRECAYKFDALDAHLNNNATLKTSPKSQQQFRAICNRMALLEASKTLREQAMAFKTMTRPSCCKANNNNNNNNNNVARSKEEMKSLQELMLKSTEEDYEVQLLHVISATTIISILTDIVICTAKIANCTTELASLAHFKPIIKQEISHTESDSESKCVEQELGKPVFVTNESQQQDQSHHVKTVSCSHVAITIDNAGD